MGNISIVPFVLAIVLFIATPVLFTRKPKVTSSFGGFGPSGTFHYGRLLGVLSLLGGIALVFKSVGIF